MSFYHNKIPAKENTKKTSIKEINLNLIFCFRVRFIYLFEWIIISFDLFSSIDAEAKRGREGGCSLDWIVFTIS